MKKSLDASFIDGESKVVNLTIKRLAEYFNHERKAFDIPLLMVGTDFQKNVWNELKKVPFGKTSSYMKIAEKIGNKKAVRAVANENGENAISIIIPYHRIIGSGGALVGYGCGLSAKKKLLKLEQDMFTQ